MEKELEKFNKFIEKYGVYSKFYEDEKTEELEWFLKVKLLQ